MRPHKRRRAGSAVQVLVAAANREVGVGGVQVDRHRAGGVREIPHDQRAGVVRGVRDVRHAMHAAGAVVDMGQHQDGDAIVQQRGNVVGVGQHQLEAVRARERVGNVEIGREVRPFGQDRRDGRGRRLATRDGDGRAQHLVEIDRGRVGDGHFARRRANQRRNLVADALGRSVDPAGGVPTANQPAAPLLLDHRGDPCRRGRRQGAERVAVEVDDAFADRHRPSQTARAAAPADRPQRRALE